MVVSRVVVSVETKRRLMRWKDVADRKSVKATGMMTQVCLLCHAPDLLPALLEATASHVTRTITCRGDVALGGGLTC